MNLKDFSLIEIIEKIKKSEITGEEVFYYFQNRIEKYDKHIHAFNFVNKNGYNNSNSVLAGAPIGVKDIFCET